MLADDEARQEGGIAERRLGAARGGRKGQPFRHGRGLVVDDIVDPGGAPLDRRQRGLRDVVDVDERPDAAAVADDREPAASNRLHERAVLRGE